MNINTKYKDRIFYKLFGKDSKECRKNALELYNALNGTEYSDPDEIEITTIDDALYMGYKNDASFLFHNEMTLLEEQSSYNPNMPIRGLTYFSQMYSAYLSEKSINVFSATAQKLPAPKYYVFYLGVKNTPDRKTLRLSDSFYEPDEAAIEVKAIMLNINYGHNKALLEKCKPLMQYSEFIHQIRIFTKESNDFKKAVERAVDYCIQNNILKDFLSKNKEEVINMYALEFHEDVFRKGLFEDGKTEGHIEGFAEGRAEGEKNGFASAIKRFVEYSRNKGKKKWTIMEEIHDMYPELTEEEIDSLVH